MTDSMGFLEERSLKKVINHIIDNCKFIYNSSSIELIPCEEFYLYGRNIKLHPRNPLLHMLISRAGYKYGIYPMDSKTLNLVYNGILARLPQKISGACMPVLTERDEVILDAILKVIAKQNRPVFTILALNFYLAVNNELETTSYQINTLKSFGRTLSRLLPELKIRGFQVDKIRLHEQGGVTAYIVRHIADAGVN